MCRGCTPGRRTQVKSSRSKTLSLLKNSEIVVYSQNPEYKLRGPDLGWRRFLCPGNEGLRSQEKDFDFFLRTTRNPDAALKGGTNRIRFPL
jgi:hypothetical protein